VRIVAVTSQFPLPLDAGGPLRFYGLTKALAAAHDVRLLARARPSTTDDLAREMEAAIDGPVEVFQSSPPAGFAGRWGRALAKGTPPWIRAQWSEELAGRLRTLAPGADVVVLLDDYAGAYTEVAAGRAPVVVDKSNVMGWTLATAGAPPGARARALHPLALHLIRRFERGYVRRADAVFVTSGEESTRLERLYGRAADAVVPSAVELPPAATSSDGARAVGWLGIHDYEPNLEGLVRFVEEGWEPLGREGWRLLVAGGDPPPRVRKLERLQGVEITGFVERLEDLFSSISAGVVPLWRGAGVKLKTLTFMAAGVPVAATPVALEGLEVEDGRHCLVADDAPGLAAALQRMLADPALLDSLGREGRRLVAESYTWDRVGPRFVQAVERAAAPC
jgi:glycosyltransferase involved in cell wall biosynthesis